MIIYNDFKKGYNEVTNMETKAPDMLMDIGVYKATEGEIITFCEADKEVAILLLDGTIQLEWEKQLELASRKSLFDENPSVLHVAKGVEIKITAKSNAEFLIQKTTNDQIFPSKYYSQKDVTSQVFGENVWKDTARRTVRTVFDYNNAPYSNMVIGEVINYPGKWSSYIPHGHDQPEVYLYKFDREQGFGAGFIGDDVYKIKHNSALCIPGGPTHPQTAAPGYAMYYCWMIRHFDGNPWTDRVNDLAHTWLLEDNPKIWG